MPPRWGLRILTPCKAIACAEGLQALVQTLIRRALLMQLCHLSIKFLFIHYVPILRSRCGAADLPDPMRV